MRMSKLLTCGNPDSPIHSDMLTNQLGLGWIWFCSCRQLVFGESDLRTEGGLCTMSSMTVTEISKAIFGIALFISSCSHIDSGNPVGPGDGTAPKKNSGTNFWRNRKRDSKSS